MNVGNQDNNPTESRILLCMCKMSGHEMPFIEEAFRDEWVVPLGPNVNGFEEDLKGFLKSVPHGNDNRASLSCPANSDNIEVVALASGTSALHLALILAGVGPGDEVMVQSFTFSASANPVKYLGGKPVFVDSEPETWNMDPMLLETGIEERISATGRKPKAIIAVDLYGMPARLEDIKKIAERYEIPLIEDAAEAFGSRFNGCCCGTFGKFGILSFNGNKMITTSGGGALICHDPEMRKKAMYLATQARQGYAYYQHEDVGYNYRLSNISAGIGRGQMKVLEDYIAHHRHRQAYYRDKFAALPGVRLHENPSPEFDSNFWLVTITIDPKVRIKGWETAYDQKIQGTIGGAGGVTGTVTSSETDCQPDADIEALRLRMSERNIETRPLWKPMHRQPVFADCPAIVNGTAERIFKRGLCLPAGPWVTDKDADRVVECLRDSIIS